MTTTLFSPAAAPATPLLGVAPEDMADAYRIGMRSLAAGVNLITTRHAGASGGMIATAVTSVSAEPPTLLICVNRSASLFEMLQASGQFCVNVLGADATALVDVFSSSARRAERFQSGQWLDLPSGMPASGQALVAFDCRVAKVVDWHSHSIFFGEVVNVVHPSAAQQPLLYMDRQFHRLQPLTS